MYIELSLSAQENQKFRSIIKELTGVEPETHKVNDVTYLITHDDGSSYMNLNISEGITLAVLRVYDKYASKIKKLGEAVVGVFKAAIPLWDMQVDLVNAIENAAAEDEYRHHAA